MTLSEGLHVAVAVRIVCAGPPHNHHRIDMPVTNGALPTVDTIEHAARAAGFRQREGRWYCKLHVPVSRTVDRADRWEGLLAEAAAWPGPITPDSPVPARPPTAIISDLLVAIRDLSSPTTMDPEELE